MAERALTAAEWLALPPERKRGRASLRPGWNRAHAQRIHTLRAPLVQVNDAGGLDFQAFSLPADEVPGFLLWAHETMNV